VDESSGHGCAWLCLIGAIVGVAGLPLLLILGVAAMGADEPDTPVAGDVAGIPARVVQAYRAAGGRCPGLDWTLLAAVGEVETDHGQFGRRTVDPQTGEVRPWVFGPALDGTGGTASMAVGGYLGWWGLTGPWLQAVGPMQFLPGTFLAHAVDADEDGVANPHDVDDAVATTAETICASAGGNVEGPDEIARIYNPGDAAHYAAALHRAQARIEAAAEHQFAVSTCPVAGAISYSNTFGAPRSGGRSHKGVDIFAAEGTPVVAPEDGRVEHFVDGLGGNSYRLFGDSGTYYYGTHLSGFANVGVGHVAAGTVVGFVGHTGNAAGTGSHLHWEVHPGGPGSEAVDPTPWADSVCAGNRS
jgi:murein DD-endopeptidase MepM/ murein hydrolase activator NlpD